MYHRSHISREMWKYMLLINKILPKIQIGYGQKMFSSVVIYKPTNHPNSPQLFSPTDGIMLSKHKTNHFNTLCTEFHFKTSRLPQVRTKFSSRLQCPKGRVSAHLSALLHTHTHTHTHARPWWSSFMSSPGPQDFWSDCSSLRGALLPTFHGSSIPIPHPQENFSDPQYWFRLLYFFFYKIIFLP